MPSIVKMVAQAVAALAVAGLATGASAVETAILTPGLYECLAQGQYFFLSLGSDLVYHQTEPAADPGEYEIDAATGSIRFTTGPYAIGQWTAEVHNAADRGGIILHADQDYECRAAR